MIVEHTIQLGAIIASEHLRDCSISILDKRGHGMELKRVLGDSFAVDDKHDLPRELIGLVSEDRLHYAALIAVVSREHDDQDWVVGSVVVELGVCLNIDHNHFVFELFFLVKEF